MQNIFSSFETHKLTADDLNIKVEYLVPNVLPKQIITMIFAKAGQGKSFFILALAVLLLKSKKIKNCYYLDFDNSTMALKSRGLEKLITKYPNLHYVHNSKHKNLGDTLLNLADDVQKNNLSLKDNLIIIDSIRNLIGGRDMNSDKEIRPVMDSLQVIRDGGCNVMFLHHTPKDSDGTVYKGSTSFIDSIDVAYSLTSEKDHINKLLTYNLNVIKDRMPVNNVSYRLDTSNFELVDLDYSINSLPEHQGDIAAKVRKVLELNPNGLNQTELLLKIGSNNDDKTARKYLDEFSGKLWRVEKVPSKKNAKYYFPLEVSAS